MTSNSLNLILTVYSVVQSQTSVSRPNHKPCPTTTSQPDMALHSVNSHEFHPCSDGESGNATLCCGRAMCGVTLNDSYLFLLKAD